MHSDVYEQGLVSICIPTYNRPKLITVLLDSILEQSYRNFEIIITDNSCSNETRDLIRNRYRDGRIKYYMNEANLGMSGNTLKALSYVKGEYFTFTPDDDVWLCKNKLEKQVNLLEAHANVSICFSNLTHINFDGSSHPIQFKLLEENSDECNIIESDSLLLTNKDRYFVNILTALIRREQLEQFKKSWRFGSEEHFMWHTGGTGQKIGFCREKFVAHRDGEHNWDVPDGKGGLINYRNNVKKRANMIAAIYSDLMLQHRDELIKFDKETNIEIAKIIIRLIGFEAFIYSSLIVNLNLLSKIKLYAFAFWCQSLIVAKNLTRTVK